MLCDGPRRPIPPLNHLITFTRAVRDRRIKLNNQIIVIIIL